jgi:putative ABC transport system permease protein
VLSHGLWQRRFGGDASIIGRAVTLNRETYEVIGVMPESFDFPSRFDEFWVPLRDDPDRDRDLHFLQSIGRLAEGATLATARREMTLIFDRMRLEYPEVFATNQPNLETRRDFIASGSRRMLLMLSGAVAVLLLVACANLANLMLIKATTRARELGVRSALGAGHGRLLRQLLAESSLLALFGAAAGVAIAFGATRLVLLLGPETLPRRNAIGVDARALAFTLVAALVSVVLFALVPALRASRADVHSVLREGGRSTPSGRTGRLQRGLVVAQVALALALLTCAGLLVNSFVRLASRPPGFDAGSVLSVRVAPSGDRYSDTEPRVLFFDQVLERVRALPNVQRAGGTWSLPFAGGHASGKIVVEGIPVRLGEEPQVGMYPVHGEFFQTMRVPLLSGRWLGAEDVTDGPAVALISQGMAQRFWPGQDAVGKRFKTGGVDEVDQEPFVTVVGVVGDVKRESLETEDAAVEMYAPFTQSGWVREMYVVLRTNGDPLRLVEPIKAAVRAVDPETPVTNIATMEQRLSQSVSQPRFRAFLLGCFATLAGLLALVGIYGVLSFAVAQRTHEIGVRMALGAARSEVIRDVMGQGARLAAIGIVIGVATAAASSALLTDMLFEVDGLDAPTYLAVIAVLLAGATLACLIPAYRASRVDPMSALRKE